MSSTQDLPPSPAPWPLEHVPNRQPKPSPHPLLGTFFLHLTLVESWLFPENSLSQRVQLGATGPLPALFSSQPGSLPSFGPLSTLVGAVAQGLCHAYPYPRPRGTVHTITCPWNQERGSCTSPETHEGSETARQEFQGLWYPELDLGDCHAETGHIPWLHSEDHIC